MGKMGYLPPTLALYAMPTLHWLLLAVATTTPAHRVPCLQNSMRRSPKVRERANIHTAQSYAYMHVSLPLWFWRISFFLFSSSMFAIICLSLHEPVHKSKSCTCATFFHNGIFFETILHKAIYGIQKPTRLRWQNFPHLNRQCREKIKSISKSISFHSLVYLCNTRLFQFCIHAHMSFRISHPFVNDLHEIIAYKSMTL